MKKFFFMIFLLSVVSCKEGNNEGDFFFLINKGAKMPVLVRGNKSAGIFILFVHGGPGGTAFQKIGLPAFDHLENLYAVVYWDQRGSGSSQGDSPNSLFTLDQFVEDLDQVINLVRYRYHNPEIFLMGHSFGGCLGTAYLADGTRQDKVKGWIEVDGAHNNPKADSLSLDWITSYAQNRINNNVDVDFWKYALGWYARNPNFTSDQLEHYAFLEKANGYVHDPSVKRKPTIYSGFAFDYVFNSPADDAMALTNYNHVLKTFIISDIDLTLKMKNITVPTLMIWGKFDGVIPYPMAAQALNALGTPVSQKGITTLMNSGHVGFYEEPDLFVGAVNQFVEAHK